MHEQAAKRRMDEANAQKKPHKWKLDEMQAEEKNLHAQLQKLKKEQSRAQELMKCQMKYIDEGGKKIGSGLKNQDMMEVEAGNELVVFWRESKSVSSR